MQRILNYAVDQSDIEKIRIIHALLEQDPQAELLDCGCSDGLLTVELAKTIGTSRVFGIDVVPQKLAAANALEIDTRLGDLNDPLPFEDESFDVLLANHVIEHLNDTDAFIREMRRVLKVGGYAIIATSNLAALYNIVYLLLGRQPYVAMVSDEILAGTWMPLKRGHPVADEGPGHRRVFTLRALEQLLEHHGFQVERSIGSGYFPLFRPLARIMCRIDKMHATSLTVKVRKAGK